MKKRTMNVDPFEIIQTIDEPLCVLNEASAIIFANQAFDDSFGVLRLDIEGRSVFEVGEKMLDLPIFHERLAALFKGEKRTEEFEVDHHFPKIGQHVFVIKCDLMRRYRPGSEKQVLIRFEDITEQVRAERTLRIRTQEILEISTPISKVWNEILILPLIGTIDPNRANRMREELLEAIRRENARSVIMDGTGLTLIDDSVARTIIETISAVKLLGSQVIMTGINPDIAMTIVQLGIELRDISSRATLQEGIQAALEMRGYAIIMKPSLQRERQTGPISQTKTEKSTLRIINPYREP